MEIAKPCIELFTQDDPKDICARIELYGRTCYQSHAKKTDDSYDPFIRGAISRGHFSIIEHEKVTAKVNCDRGVTHQIVRHRLGSYSQESTRYVSYQRGITVIQPCFLNGKKDDIKQILWEHAMADAEKYYAELVHHGCKPEEARAVLPNSLRSELIITYNLREWRHFFWLRCSPGAHIQIREVAIELLRLMQEYLPIIFDDFKINKKKMIAETKICPAS